MTICSIIGSNHTFTFFVSSDSESGIAQCVSLSGFRGNVLSKFYNSVSLSKLLDLVFFSFCHLQFHRHKSKPRPQAYEEMSHAGWQVIEFVSLRQLLFFVKMFNFSLIQNLHLVMRIKIFPVFSFIFIFDDKFKVGMHEGRIQMSRRSTDYRRC
jgi:hypothetical protein